MLRICTLILLWTMMVVGCSGRFLSPPPVPPKIETQRFVVVTAGQQDTLASLARTYLNDEDKGWQIAAYNDIDTLTPGQQVVIPRVPLKFGGIEQNGFQTVPVLLYTEITPQPSKSKATYAKDFDRQLQYLDDNGFVTASLDEFREFLSFSDQLPPKTVIISFDTTRLWVYEIAFPMLKLRGMKAAIFIRLNEVGSQSRLTWAQLAEMAAGGFDVGLLGETILPPANHDLKRYFDLFEKKFTTPQKAFMTHLKQPCRYFAYPGGVDDDLTIAMLKKHGYRMAFTRKRNSNPFFTDNYKIKRSLIFGHFDMAQFRQNLITFRSAELR
jgi:peptidoglycan/xylan/chitin deacetylase (PgdA/CDA1 family)